MIENWLHRSKNKANGKNSVCPWPCELLTRAERKQLQQPGPDGAERWEHCPLQSSPAAQPTGQALLTALSTATTLCKMLPGSLCHALGNPSPGCSALGGSPCSPSSTSHATLGKCRSPQRPGLLVHRTAALTLPELPHPTG